MEKVQWVIDNGDQLIEAALMFVGFFAALAALTTTKKDDSIAGYLSRAIDILALNVGKAKNDPKDAK